MYEHVRAMATERREGESKRSFIWRMIASFVNHIFVLIRLFACTRISRSVSAYILFSRATCKLETEERF